MHKCTVSTNLAFLRLSNTYKPAAPSPKIAVYLGKAYVNYFSGDLADVQIYNTSLSANSISSLYIEGIGGAPINTRNLVGWWPLNDNANDYSGNGDNGVATSVFYTTNWDNGYTQP